MTRVCVGIRFVSDLASLRRTLAGLRKHTPRSAGQVVLAGGLDPATELELRAVHGVPQLLSRRQESSAAAFNRLASVTDSEILVFLSSGVLVGEHWLERSLAALYADLANGLVLCQACAANSFLLLRREVVCKVGLADPASDHEFAWIDDYCQRAKEAGFKTLSAGLEFEEVSPGIPDFHQDTANFKPAAVRAHERSQSRRLRLNPSPTVPIVRPRSSGFADVGTFRTPVLKLTAPQRDAATPLVSCIMPTRDRRAFLRQAIRYFLRQDYPHRELIILDDSHQPVGAEIPDNPMIRYEQLPPGQSIGAKRNRGCEIARGSIVAHWDDDDWYAPCRLAAQVEPLLAGTADITALTPTMFFDVERWEFWHCSADEHRRLFVGNVHGGTLVFYRFVWQKLARYPCVSLAEDAGFLRQAIRNGARLLGIRNHNLFLYLRHNTNTWFLNCRSFHGSSHWQLRNEPPMPPEDRSFYAARSVGLSSLNQFGKTSSSCRSAQADG